MTNENCLKGLRCPNCGNEDRLFIVTTVVADVTDDGAGIAGCGPMEWDDTSFTRCPECDRDGPLKAFRIVPALSPDPDGMNDRRAEWAGHAIATFRSATGTDEADAVCDLIANVMHWCDRHGQDFGKELSRAEYHYAAETGSDDPTE